jgi:hypothetical protein
MLSDGCRDANPPLLVPNGLKDLNRIYFWRTTFLLSGANQCGDSHRPVDFCNAAWILSKRVICLETTAPVVIAVASYNGRTMLSTS